MKRGHVAGTPLGRVAVTIAGVRVRLLVEAWEFHSSSNTSSSTTDLLSSPAEMREKKLLRYMYMYRTELTTNN